MKNFIGLTFTVLILLLYPLISEAQSKHVDYEKRLTELGIHLFTPKKPTASFLKARRVGNLVFLSGHGPDKPDGGRIIGKVGKDLTVEQGKEAARLACISLLSSLKAEIGNLNKVKKIVSVFGMVNADPSFDQPSQVINGCSDLLVDVFGENGKHVRSAVGMSTLQFNQAVEIQMIVELKK